MTDKEIIEIDGVDVSRCKYLPYCNDKQGNCAFEPNCYYKQLKRKTQELELAERLINGILKTLNLEAYDWRADQNEILAEIRGFKKEYEELKKELRELKLKHTTLQNRYQQLDGATRYRKALEEVEAEATSLKCFNFGYDELGIGQDIIAYADDILNIINKAKGGTDA